MTTYISILRGINVTGHNKLPMTDLKKLYGDLKLKNPVTYIQSGNVLFQSEERDKSAMAKKITKGISNKYGYDVPVLILTVQEIAAIIKNNPFPKKKGIDTNKLHVTFLEMKPQKENADKIDNRLFDPDQFMIIEKTVYLYCPDGYGRTKLNNNFFENKLKVTATTRNWRTVNELLKISESLIS